MAKVMEYMKLLANANNDLTFDQDNEILYHRDATRGDQVKAFVIADGNGRRLPLRSLTGFIGNGMLGGIIASDRDVDSEAHAGEPYQQEVDANASATTGFKGTAEPEIVCLQAGPTVAWQTRATPYQSGFEVLEIDDVVGPIITPDQSHKPLYPELPGAGAILVAKVCGVLSSVNYDAATISKVGKLVNRNTITAVHYQGLPLQDDIEAGEKGWIERRSKALLSTLLDHDQKRLRSVNMNSNEPVVLINSFGGLDDGQIEALADTVNHLLQKQWNIWPVRLYAGPYLELPEHSPFREYGFSISLLNVVNTEIGGPSMVQLLDHDCDSESYLGSLRKNERHHKGEMKIFIVTSDSAYEHKVEISEISRGTAPATESDASSEASVDGSVSDDDDVAGAGTFEGHEEDAAMPVNATTEASMPVAEEEDHADSRAQFHQHAQTSAPSIKHPTWTHASGDESLLDLIRRQASNAEDSDEAQDQDDADTTSNKSSQSDRSARSEEGFVVV